MFKYRLFIFFCFFIFGCKTGDKQKNQVVAQVGSNKLFVSDVSSVIPPDIEPEDSSLMAEDYIEKWIKRELLLQKAEENLSASDKDVTKQLEEYRKSMIIYKYKNALVTQRMDTIVTDDQIRQYYSEHPERFRLKKTIVKAIYLKINNEFANPGQLKEMCSNTTTEGIIELRDYCLQYAKGFDIFTDRWVDFQLVAKNIPYPIENPDQFLQQNQMIERTDSNYYYLVAVHDYKLKNEQAPIEYAKNDIKNLILNRRKIDFLKQLENNVYSEGITKNKFQIYKTEINDAE